MSDNQEYQFGQGWKKYLKSEYSLEAPEIKESFPSQDVSADQSEEYKFGSGHENIIKSYEDTGAPSEEYSPVKEYAEKLMPSVAVGATTAVAPALASGVFQSGKYALQHPAARTAAAMAVPAYQVLRGRPPADLMQRAANLVSQPAFERGILGGTEDLAGTTGRARQTMYNTETARQAAIRRGVDNPFTRSTWGASNTGVLVPPGTPSPKPAGGLSAMLPPQAMRAATEVKDFASAVAPKVAARGMGGFGLGFSGAETLRTGAEAMKDPAAIPEFVLNAIGTIGGLGVMFPPTAAAAAPFAIGAPALASAIGVSREGKKIEAQKNLAAKERFEALPETTPGERGLVELRGPAMSRSDLGYRDARKGALYYAEP